MRQLIRLKAHHNWRHGFTGRGRSSFFFVVSRIDAPWAGRGIRHDRRRGVFCDGAGVAVFDQLHSRAYDDHVKSESAPALSEAHRDGKRLGRPPLNPKTGANPGGSQGIW
jgi:hypothetical protein